MQPVINNECVGYMILDTGASGFVLEKNVADMLGLASFGELYVSGLAHKVLLEEFEVPGGGWIEGELSLYF